MATDSRHRRAAFLAVAVCGWVAAAFGVETSSAPRSSQATNAAPASQAMLDTYCVTCHNQRLKTAGLALDTFDATTPQANPDVWERVITRLRAGSMPPAGRPRPDAATYEAVASALEADIDRAWIANPTPGRVNAVHRLNRTQYANAVRDLFALEPKAFDVKSLLPGDETADGSFDNFADVLTISTAHLERYLSAARQVTRLATGLPPSSPALATFEIPLHVVQDDRQDEDLPFGSRGGIAVHYAFPVDGEYLIKVRLRRQYQDYLMGMGWPQQLDVRLDGKLLKRFTVGGKAPGTPAASSYAGDGEPGFAGAPEWETYMQLTGDAGLEVRVPVSAGPRVVGVSFVRELWEPEGLAAAAAARTRADQRSDLHGIRGRRLGPDRRAVPRRRVRQRTRRAGARSSSASRTSNECVRARAASERLATHARRDPVADGAPGLPPAGHEGGSATRCWSSSRRAGATAASFEAGIQFALERMLVDPDFLLRVQRDPPASRAAHRRYRLTDVELASRLSFFLWSSLPDERAARSRPSAASCRSRRFWNSRCGACWPIRARPPTLVDDFAAQWLNLRRVGEVVAHPDVYPDFDDNLLDGLQAGDRALHRQHPARGSQRVGPAARRLYVRQRAAGAPLRHSRHLRPPLPARRAPEPRSAWRPARARRAAGDDVVSGPHLAGAARQVAARQHLRRPGAAAAGKRRHDVCRRSGPAPRRRPSASGSRSIARIPTCASCHAVIDPPGFALEHFDAIGAVADDRRSRQARGCRRARP